MALNQLTDESYSRKNRKRVGRGIGSGKGKTCGSGHKGQKSRSGVSINGFEGGQMPIYMRLPKRGFVNSNREIIDTVNLQDLQAAVDKKLVDAKKEITPEILAEIGLVKKGLKVKLLGKGKITDAVKVSVHHVSASAEAAVKKASGAVTLISKGEDAKAAPKEKKAAPKDKTSKAASAKKDK
tara:strand:+ start:100 stop:645 length:546 start_codon:yes stop_codon:yes gene_type:complete